MQWNKTPCPYLKTILRQVQNGEQTQELRLPEEMPDIGRVLCGWGQPMIRSKQWRSDGISVSGGVSGSVMYLPEDGSQPRVMEAWIPFQMKWNLPQTQRQGMIRLKALLNGMEARMLSDRKMMLRATVSLLVEAMEPVEADIYSPTDLPAGVEVLTRTYPAVLPREAGEKEFQFEDDVRIPNVSKWVCWEMMPRINEESVVGSRAVIRGSGQLHYVYMDEEGNVHSGRQEIPFAQFIDLDREYGSDASVDVMLAVAGLEPEITEDGAHIQCSLSAQYVLWDQTLLEVAEDAYSPTGKVELSTEMLQLPMELDSRTETVNAQSQFRDGKVVDMTFLPDFPGQFREADQLNISPGGDFQILYEDADGSLQTTLERWSEDMPLPAGADTQLTTSVLGVESQNDAMTAEMKLGLRTKANQQIPMLTGLTLEEREQPDEERPTLILRRMDAESLWELAKRSGSTMEAIRKANGLTQEPEQGQMLLIPIG